MIVRALDVNGDWTFGKGKNDYLSGVDAVAQSISTRLDCFLGDCFFSTSFGIDWWNLLGTKQELALSLAISAMILNTPEVLSLEQLSISLDPSTRNLTVVYTVNTIYGRISEIAGQNVANLLLTEGGSVLAAEDGSFLSV